MSTVNFSVPERVKEEFNTCFAGENKSAVMARLMEQAIDEKKKQARRAAAIDVILELRKTAPRMTHDEIQQARQECRE